MSECKSHSEIAGDITIALINNLQSISVGFTDEEMIKFLTKAYAEFYSIVSNPNQK
jgi:hypothetical protein